LPADKLVKWGKKGVEAVGMLKADKEDMSTTEAGKDTVVEGFSVCHRAQILGVAALDDSSRVNIDLKYSISAL